MKRFILRLILLFVIIVLIDRLGGALLGYVYKNIPCGAQQFDNYICDQTKDDILIFGSSRAIHHYNPQIIEDSLKLKCYNCGMDGNGIILHYGRLKMINERYIPRYIIYDITPEFDLFEGDNRKYLGWLKYRYDRNGISDIFHKIDPNERLKMYSNLYRYNSDFFQKIMVFIFSYSPNKDIKGFVPLNGSFDSMKIKKETTKDNTKYDKLKIYYLNQFVEISKNTKLIFVVSPLWYGMDSEQLQPLTNICTSNKLIFIDFSNSPKYVHNDIYFKDGAHLNAYGADEFTKDLMIELRKRNVLE